MTSVAPRAGVDRPAAGAGPWGRIFDLKRFSTHDGPGIRSTVFLCGCPLRCAWCHNPEAFATDEGNTGGTREVSAHALVRELERDLPYFDRSGGGITLSGGEPLGQPEFTLAVLDECRRHDLHTAVDTAGLADPAVIEAVARRAALILYDLKSIDDATHLRWTGVSNMLILENLHMLDRLDAAVWIRIPLVPGVNDDPASLDAFLAELRGTRFRRVSILPFHHTAAAKYRRLGLPDRMAGVEPPAPAAVEAARQRFAAAGFEARTGR